MNHRELDDSERILFDVIKSAVFPELPKDTSVGFLRPLTEEEADAFSIYLNTVTLPKQDKFFFMKFSDMSFKQKLFDFHKRIS